MSLYEIRIKVESYEDGQHLFEALKASKGDEEITFHDITPCDVIVRHGPGHMSTTECEAVGDHCDQHHAIIMGCYEEWSDEDKDPDGKYYIQ